MLDSLRSPPRPEEPRVQGIVKKQFVQLDGPGAALGARHASASQRCAASARLLKVEGVVRAIEFTCSCGEATTIELEYGKE